MAAFLLSDPVLRPYVDDVRAWHGYVRFLGLPTIQDHPDTPLSDLFVSPLLSHDRVMPGSSPSTWPSGQGLFEALRERRHLVVLGDPGSGKSSMLNWLAWLLAGGAEGVLPEWLEDVLPIPLVARELKLDRIAGFDDLIQAFLDRPVAAHLRHQPEILSTALTQGRAMILLDGLDEVSLDLRLSLRDAVLEGLQRSPGIRLLATSRIVGYDECPLEPVPRGESPLKVGLASLRSRADGSPLYVMPFDDARIATFARQWYALRSIRPSADQDAIALTDALHRAPAVLELARTPQLLTLMALVYRVRAQLPDGRAMLYDLITEAYLESIDRARDVGRATIDRYPWREKRRWLARVGFEMQILRSTRDKSESRELLATRQQVLLWIKAAMETSSYASDAGFASSYLDWVARRSGLLLPRGEDLFAFVHLSFQEYFAALYLVEHAADADWVMAQRSQVSYPEGDPRINSRALASWAQDKLWQEALIFAQESFAHASKDARRFAFWLFGEGYADFAEEVESFDSEQPHSLRSDRGRAALAWGELLARIASDPHAGLPQAEILLGLRVVLAFCERVEGRFGGAIRSADDYSGALERLLAAEGSRETFWQLLAERAPACLNLTGGGIIGADRFASFDRLTFISIDELDGASLDNFARFESLESLQIERATEISSFSPLSGLTNLWHLSIANAPVDDLEPIAALPSLQILSIEQTLVEDLKPLQLLPSLTFLNIAWTRVSSLQPLRSCRELVQISIYSTPVTDLSPLDQLPNLAWLQISEQHRLTPALRSRWKAKKLKVLGVGDPALDFTP